jgi:uncharacterized protein (DUF488 family)
MRTPAYDLFTIGHSNIPADRFVAMLHEADVDAIADVRSVPASRRFPWFSAKALGERLARESIAYEFLAKSWAAARAIQHFIATASRTTRRWRRSLNFAPASTG